MYTHHIKYLSVPLKHVITQCKRDLSGLCHITISKQSQPVAASHLVIALSITFYHQKAASFL